MTRSGFPKPPFRTHGSGLAIPCIVSSRNVRVPPEFSVIHPAGRTLGMLVYVEYANPSPRSYRELIWVSAIVRCRDRSYSVPQAFGPLYYVARSYADHPEVVEEGKGEWGVARNAARFSRQGNCIEMEGEDGTRLAFSFKPRGFTFVTRTSLASLQKERGRILCFRAGGRAEVQFATCRIEEFEAGHPDWESFQNGLVLPGVASHVRAFELKYREPLEVRRGLHSIAPAPSMV